jgi:hypothetical protein
MRLRVACSLAAVVPLAATIASAGGVCIEAAGSFERVCAFTDYDGCKKKLPPQWSCTDEERAAALDPDALLKCYETPAETKAFDEEGARLGRVAHATANAACEADGGFASSVKVYAYVDATVIEVKTLHTDWIRDEADARKIVLSYGSVPLRAGDPVVVRVFPVRLGDPPASLVAIVRKPSDARDPEARDIEWVVRPAPLAKPVRK